MKRNWAESLNKVKNGKHVELLNSDKHKNILKKHNRELGSARPDITHQTLLCLMDSPLNRAQLLQVYIRTTKNVLIEINPQVVHSFYYSFRVSLFQKKEREE